MSRPSSLLLPALVLAGCGDNLDARVVEEPWPRYPGAAVVMAYNVAQQSDGPRGQVIAAHIAARAPDFVALQELAEPVEFLAVLPDRYELTEPPHSGIAVLYDAAAWRVEEQGALELGVDDDGWGARKVIWGRFVAREGGARINVYSTHWCYPDRTDDDRCDEARHVEYAGAMADYIHETRGDDPAVAAGDLNVWQHYEEGVPFRTLIDSGLLDVYRVLHPDGPGITRPSPSGDAGGRVDFILSTTPVDVLNVAVEDQIPIGDGSDHYGLVAALRHSR